MKTKSTLPVLHAGILASCILGVPTLAFGEDAAPAAPPVVPPAPEKPVVPPVAAKPAPPVVVKPKPVAPAAKPAEVKKPFVPDGMPGHGVTGDKGPTSADQKPVDLKPLAKAALDTSAKVTQVAPTVSELEALLERAKNANDSMSRDDIVKLRINLQRFRGQGDEIARVCDEESNRLEALLKGLAVKPGSSITGQKSVGLQGH